MLFNARAGLLASGGASCRVMMGWGWGLEGGGGGIEFQRLDTVQWSLMEFNTMQYTNVQNPA